jgi:peptide-methionine (R)-S-oxide reductase
MNIHEDGYISLAACKNPLFAEKTKFESGTGWPSFYEPHLEKCGQSSKDNTYGMDA